MHDVDARLLLLDAQAPADVPRLCAALAALAALPVEDRWPYYAAVARRARHPDPAVRAACLRALAGAEGLPAERLVVAGLHDGDAAVRAAAVDAVDAARASRPAWWAHVIAHPDPALRVEAARRAPTEVVGLWVRLLAEPAARDLVWARLRALPGDPALARPLLQHHAAGHLAPDALGPWLAALPWRRDPAGVLATLWPPRAVDLGLPRGALDLGPALAEAASRPDGLDPVLAFLATHASGALELVADELLVALCQRRLDLQPLERVATSLLLAAPGRWSALPAAGLGLALAACPAVLHALPSQAARAALVALAPLGDGAARRLDLASLDLRALLGANGVPAAEILPGLCALGGPRTLAAVAAVVPPAALARGLSRHPGEAALLLGQAALHDGASRAAADQLLAALLAHGGGGLPALLAALLARDPDRGARAVSQAGDPELTVRVILHVDQALEHQPDPARKAGRLAARLAPLLARPLPELAGLLRREGAPGPLLRALLVEVLREATGPEIVAGLEADGLHRLAELDQAGSLVPWPVFERIAAAVRAPPTPTVAAWLAPARSPGPRRGPALPPPALRRALTAEEAERIATCADAALKRAVAPALASPVRGLCAALARRSPAPDASTCAALLLSDDPLPEVARELARFGLDEARITQAVDQLLVAACAHRAELGPGAAAWLHRWDVPHAAFAAWLGDAPGALSDVLHASLSLASPALRANLWRAGRYLLGKWRWRDRARVHAAVAAGLPALLVDTLGDLGAAGRGPRGYPCSARDRDEVQLAACQVLAALHEIGVDLGPWRPRITALLPGLGALCRRELEAWISSRGLAAAAARAAGRAQAPVDAAEIEASVDVQRLRDWAGAAARGVAELATLRLLELGEAGQAALLAAILAPEAPHRAFLASSLSAWSEGPALAAAGRALRDPATRPEARLHLGLGLAGRGGAGAAPIEAAVQAAVEAACAPLPAGAMPWLGPAELAALCAAHPDHHALSLRLWASPHPAAYAWAAAALAARRGDPAVDEALAAFLRLGPDRAEDVRVAVARALVEGGDTLGLPLLLAWHLARARRRQQDEEARRWARALPAAAVEEAVEAALLADEAWAPGGALVEGLLQPGVDPDGVAAGAVAVLRDARRAEVQTRALDALSTHATRHRAARRVAEVFLWGREQSRRLLGRALHVRMIAGDALGWTRLQEPVIQVNPLAILRGERDGEAVVRGLIVHELGHHLYNADPDGLAAGAAAAREGLSRLLNLVQDEHLERNLRARDRGYDRDLKRLAAWAFLHARRELPARPLFDALGPHAVPVLVRAGLGPARRPGVVSIGLGGLLRAWEAHGGSFARFVRALRLGLGDRHADPRVAAGLALFDRGFRAADNARLLEITRQLRALFGDEVALLDLVDVHDTAAAGDGEEIGGGAGVTDAEVQREVERIERDRADPRPAPTGRGGDGDRDVINVGRDAGFDPIHDVRVLPCDRERARALAAQVQRPAARLRAQLATLGLRRVPVRPRTAGHRLDRGRVLALAVRRDPRALVAGRIQRETDLFIGLAVDCSGSMSGPRMERARRFAALVAEACRGLPQVDLRLLGFTDRIIYDAGDAARPAAHALEAGGGNNDAAGLWHAATLARRSGRSARLLIVVSDGLPTECTTTALRRLVSELQRRRGMVCAQVAVARLHERCFDTTIEVLDDDADRAVRDFGRAVSGLVTRTLKTRS